MGDGRRPQIMILAGEYSGALYGSYVAAELRRLDPGVKLTGIGGHHMAQAGVELLFDSSNWGGIGIIEALKRSHLYFVYLKLKRILRIDRPDVIVLIDYPGFNMHVARFAKSIGIPTLYYLPPGKYRSNPDDVRGVARTITRVAAPLGVTFEKYRVLDANVEFVGHPLLDVLPTDLRRPRARRELALRAGERLVGLLPGSRLAEIEHHTPVLCQVARVLSERVPRLKFVIPVVHYRTRAALRKVLSKLDLEIRKSGVPIRIVMDQTYPVMVASEVLLLASGTATLEAAFYQTPMVIVYRTSKLTELLARLIYGGLPYKYVGLPNILADREVVPELIQASFSEQSVVREAESLLTDPARYARMKRDLEDLRPLLGTRGASERVARMALEMAA